MSRLTSSFTCQLISIITTTLPNQMISVFSESNSLRICHSTSTSTLLVLSASFNYDNYAASDVLWMTTPSLHSFMRSSRAESIIAAVSRLALRGRRPTRLQRVLNSAARIVSNTRKFDRDSLISGEVSYTGWTLSTGFGSEFASRCSDVSTRRLLNTCLSTYCQPVSGISGRRHLRSTDRGHLHFPRVKLASYGGRSFAYAGPSNWNSLPPYLRVSSLSLSSFKYHLKTFLFSFY